MTGYCNTHSFRLWATENPLATQPVPLHPAGVTQRCGFTASSIIGPYLYEETGPFGPVTVTVTVEVQWQSGRLSCLHARSPGFKSRTRQGRLILSSPQ
ncbi:uncharacterized protein TNCV_2488901 [Trichonephila clavipes]|nr:uncharacterized protein TNCV_2488901 [Trichonephila clavipes]